MCSIESLGLYLRYGSHINMLRTSIFYQGNTVIIKIQESLENSLVSASHVVVLIVLWSFERSPMRGYKMFPQIPFIFDNFVTYCAVYSLRLDMHVDYVLLQVEAIRECFPAVVTQSWLHASPPLSGVGWSRLLSSFFRVVVLKAGWASCRNINVSKKWSWSYSKSYLSEENDNIFQTSLSIIYWRKEKPI